MITVIEYLNMFLVYNAEKGIVLCSCVKKDTAWTIVNALEEWYKI